MEKTTPIDGATIEGAAAPMWALLWNNLPQRSAKTCLIDADREITYGALADEVDALAQHLRALGVLPGERVIVHLRKGIDEVTAMFAVWRLGAVAVNVNHQWTVEQLLFVAGDCRATAAIVPPAVGRKLVAGALPASLSRIVLRGPGTASGPQVSVWPKDAVAAQDFQPDHPDPGALTAIIYTSGSTGKPKGVMLTHMNIRIGAISVARYLGLDASERLLSVLPYSFDAGLNQLTTMLLVGGQVVHQPLTLPAEVVRSARDHAVTGIAGVPPLWSMVVRYLADAGQTLPSLRRVTNTGGKITPDILDLMPQVFPGADIFLMYGLTEAFRSTYLPPDRFHDKKGAIGRAVPYADIHVVKSGIGLAGPGEQGELVHAGPLVSLGYWERPDATAERIRPCPELAHLYGDQPVVWSGDLVRVDADGDLWFVGRMDDMIKTMGFRLSPTEVEDAAARTGLIRESVAFATEHPEMGQAVHLACVLDAPCDAAALRDACRSTMPPYMVPRSFYAWDGPMPRTASGKLDRPAIIAACRTGSATILT
jgi:acyl-CoA synthetase (AMP-forming)/AMP-acid ligase II